MASNALVFDEVISDLACRTVGGADESRIQPLLNRESGQPDGLLVETALERVLVVIRDRSILSLSDVSDVRRLMTSAQARRALLYVPVETDIPNPVRLLASLSRIRIVQVTVAGLAY